MIVSWESAARWLLHSAFGGGAILLTACLILSLMRQPARRQAVGQWALVAALLAAALCFFPAWLPAPWPTPVSEQQAPPAALAIEKVDNGSSLFTEDRQWRLVAIDSDVVQDQAALGDLLESATPSENATQVQPKVPADRVMKAVAPLGGDATRWQAARSALAVAIAGVYLVGASFYLGRWLLGYIGLWRIVRSCVPPPPLVANLFDEMTGGVRGLRLLVSPRVQVPLSMGVLKPTIVLPPSLCSQASLGPLRCVLAHELTHLKRHDALVNLLFALGHVVYFYMPWLGWLRRQVRLCQEYIADAVAVEHASCPADYAQFLLGLTAAPAAPAGAAGVSGNSSDLYRRINMLLQEPFRIDRRCSRLWSVGIGSLFVIGGVLVGGIGRRAEAAPAPAQQDDPPSVIFVETNPELVADDDENAPKKERHAQRDRADRSAAIEALRKALDNLPEGEARDQIAQLMKKLEAREKGSGREDRRFLRVETMPPLKINNVSALRFIGNERGRLGVFTDKPGPVLVEQLDLPHGRGLVIERLVDDSPASKAGFKANDILLEIDGKDVSDDPGQLTVIIRELKADSPIEAEVLRRGKHHTIKGIVLPKAEVREIRGEVPLWIQGPANGAAQAIDAGRAGTFIAPGGQRLGGELATAWANAPGRGVMITMFRTDDRFTGRHQEGSLVITVTGKVDDGKASVSQIRVQDGGTEKKYESISKVPEEYRDKTRNLIESAEKNASKVEVNHR